MDDISFVPTPLPRYAAKTPSVMMYILFFPGLLHIITPERNWLQNYFGHKFNHDETFR